ncbi:AfsR/SARP family transcriptional regulator [Virgisporangium aurantiacum]|uniref:SARP family transcriptional regulator n=1 Tax=Virgisporangium aurantiacum TaxID=175570 RepID=A0A8J4E3N3_9ACTN|nr:AfsR/SARP family transcriptional regulator [Virgisporangium aurantiacum]GIJ61060.1 SARP family transcriptional regulator [Virgisporangium aurantiacum]
MSVTFGVLGPVVAWKGAWDGAGDRIALKGPSHRAVLARLLVARGRVVPVGTLVDDLWVAPPAGAVAAVRTFVAALRRALEPDRPRRAPATVLVTEGPGYALRADPAAVDARRFEQAVSDAGALPPAAALSRLDTALGWWRGPAYADFADAPWAAADRARLAELRLHAVERRAAARLDLGLAAEAVPDLDAHTGRHPWREEGWRLLALALYRSGRQGEALAVLRRARLLLVDQLGVDPGPALRRLETDILHQTGDLDTPAARVWAEAASTYDRLVAGGSRTRLESTVGLLRDLAMTGGGGLAAAREQRTASIEAAEQLGDPLLTARVIGGYDVPALWPRSDDPARAAAVVAATERTLAALPPGDHETTRTLAALPSGDHEATRALAGLPSGDHEATRARLLATIAVESRGTGAPRPLEAAREAEAIARRLDDPALLAFALNGAFMQACRGTGTAPRRAAIGTELVDLAGRHGLVSFQVLGHLVRMQARSGLADFAAADRDAAAAEDLAARHERPLVGVFTAWYRVLRLAVAESAPLPVVERAYRAAATLLDDAGMPGLSDGLLPLALRCLRVWRDAPDDGADCGPYEPWARPAPATLATLPDPPAGLFTEALWCLVGRAALAAGDRATVARARVALTPAAGEWAGAGSALLTVGPVADHLRRLGR